jgi:threonine/homoserine/homoserine lactone efflux protein
MTLHIWIFYALTVMVISAIPGPNMMLVMSHGALYGWRRSMATMLGCMTALLLMITLSAAGLGIFFQTWPRIFDLVRILGAAYLIYLGIRAWHSGGRRPENIQDLAVTRTPIQRPAALYRTGILVTITNPKALLFTVALLPQFMRPQANPWIQFAELIFTFWLIEMSWYMVYAQLGTRISALLRSPRAHQILQRGTGGLFMAIGLTLFVMAALNES